jgi:protoporphyrinogen oxidase
MARVAVIGAGVTGLVAALRLARRGDEPVVFERWPGLGGMAATLDVGGGHRLERYYHHWFTSDRHVLELCDQLGVAIDWLPSSVGFFADGVLHPFTTPLDLLRFSPLPLAARLRMGLSVVRLQRFGPPSEAYEGETAEAWVRAHMGAAAWTRVWQPLMRAKFGERAGEISMSWLHSKLTVRRQVSGREARGEVLGYPRGSFESLFAALRDAIAGAGGEVRTDRPAARIAGDGDGRFVVTPGAPGSFRTGHDPREFARGGEDERFDAVLATVPGEVFNALLDDRLAEARVAAVEHRAALCLLLEIDRQVLPYYWNNIGDASDLRFLGAVEHTNLVAPERYDGRRFLYLANYLAPTDPLLALGPDELLAAYQPGLRRLAGGWSADWVRERWLFHEPSAQPVVDVGYRARIPPLATPVPGLVLATMAQIWPEDRGTNYAVRLAGEAVEALGARR